MKELGQTVEIHVFPTHGHNYFPEQYMKLTLELFDKQPRTRRPASLQAAGDGSCCALEGHAPSWPD